MVVSGVGEDVSFHMPTMVKWVGCRGRQCEQQLGLHPRHGDVAAGNLVGQEEERLRLTVGKRWGHGLVEELAAARRVIVRGRGC